MDHLKREQMKRFLVTLIALAVLATGLPPVGAPVLVTQAHAQQKNETRNRPNLFELLFGGALRKQRERVQKAQEKNKARRVIVKPARQNSAVVTTQAPVKEVV